LASFLYDYFKSNVMKGSIDLDDNTQWVCLLRNTYTTQTAATVSAIVTAYSDISTYEVTGGGTTGYTAGGTSLGATNTVTVDTANHLGWWDTTTDPSWTTSYITARYAVVYKTHTQATNALVVCCFDFGSDQTATNGTFTIQWSTAGLIRLS
jgi:hypothetical protein